MQSTRKERIHFTADRPNGRLHIGHYTGSIRSRLAAQQENVQYVMIADMLALTDNIEDPSEIAENVLRMGIEYLALGIDPERSTIFIQSLVPELSALTALYVNLSSAGDILDNPTSNEEVSRRGFGHDAPGGMFLYSISHVADITAFGADTVPVGTDQTGLVEFVAGMARQFNGRFGSVLVEPVPLVPASGGRLPGYDGRPKMGKSLDNAIYLSDDTDTVRRKIMSMPSTVADGSESLPLVYLRQFHEDPAEVAELATRLAAGGFDAGRLREVVVDVLEAFLGPIRASIRMYAEDPSEVLRILTEGSRAARTVAIDTHDRVRTAMGLRYPGWARPSV